MIWREKIDMALERRNEKVKQLTGLQDAIWLNKLGKQRKEKV